MDDIDDSVFSNCTVILQDVASDPEVASLEHQRRNRAEGPEQIPQIEEQLPAENALQDDQDPNAQVPQPSVGVQDGVHLGAQASEPLPLEQGGGGSWEVQDQVLAPFIEQTNRSAPVALNVSPEASSNPKRCRGRPPKGSAPRQGSLLKLSHPMQTRSRTKNFILPQGWIKEVRDGKIGGGSAGNKDTYYIETSTQHVCRSVGGVMDYIADKEKEQQMRNQDTGGSGVHPSVDTDKI
ncbi:hypothetical protein ACH5RR_009678 [Cinchona calisaya]|uniref:MBD domain-containing protein n=1 Tax=Cinchona calisaya TaxID=153742 RepID=A0ABD3AEV7_9GENT